MKILGYERPKRRAANAGQEPARRLGGDRRAPAAGDTAVRQALLMQLALKALDRIIADYRGLTHRKPSYAALAQYLDELERGEVTATRADTAALLQPRVRVATG
jgi:hypothetical protein